VPEVGRAISPSVSGSGKLAFSGVPVGNYLLEAAKDGFGFIQVYRRVPQPGTLTGQFRHLSWVFEGDSVCWHDLEVLRSPVEPGEMAYFEGDDEFQSGDDDNPSIALPKLLRKIEPFWLDTSEVTRGQIRMVLYESNVPKPPANEPDDDDYAAKRTPFDVAVAYAEKVGKRLPTELEFEYAATNRGRTRFPWGNDRWPGSPAWNFGGPVRTPAYDRTDTEPPCYGLMSNAVEWTSTWGPKEGDLPAETFRIVRGGPFEIVEGRQPPNPAEINPRHRFRVHSASLASDRFPQMGFRCARSERPLVLTYQPQ
jgi:formylglycine-generating enzyme required for sulfatase activity